MKQPFYSVPFYSVLIWVLCGLTAGPAARAQDFPESIDETFPVAALPLGLLGEAAAVMRMEERRFEVKNDREATEYVRRAVTVLGPEGRGAGRLVLPYDAFQEIDELEGRLRDADGAVIRTLGDDDQEDYSAISGYSLYEENRVRVAELYHGTYPYTVEFTYEIEHDGLIGWPTWRPQWHRHPVEYARFEVDVPAGMVVRYAARNAKLRPRIEHRQTRTVYRWTMTMQPASEPEPHGPSWIEQAAAVHTAPATFEIGGTRGDMRTWKAFGRWYGELSEGRDALPPTVVQEVQAMTEAASTRRDAVRRLYRYLQERTRYVSIQLGLGGWQPFAARYVHEHGYGDCKALVNYMKALLRAVGITSYPALIRHGGARPTVLADFPSNQFNHVVLAVPMPDGDTLWLECTSQTMPFGHLGARNEDRHALLITPGGGQLVRIPRSTAAQNQQIRRTRVALTAAGDATAAVQTTYTGNQQDRVRQALARQSDRDRRDWLREAIAATGVEIAATDFSDVERRGGTLNVPITLKLRRYAAATGQRLFVPLNPLERWTQALPDLQQERAQPVQFFGYPFADADTVTYVLPEGFAVEAVPDPVVEKTAFGRYEANTEVQPDGTLVHIRHVEVTQPTLPPGQYDVFRSFMQRVVQADRAQFVLVKEGDAAPR